MKKYKCSTCGGYTSKILLDLTTDVFNSMTPEEWRIYKNKGACKLPVFF